MMLTMAPVDANPFGERSDELDGLQCKLRRFTILMTFGIVSTLYGAPAQAETTISPDIRAGLLDLSDWSFTEDGPVVLGGEWDFWWGELLTEENRLPNGYYSVPGYWNGRLIEGTGSQALAKGVRPSG